MLLGYPFELVKVQQQASAGSSSASNSNRGAKIGRTGGSSAQQSGILQVLRQTTRTGGVRALFRGLPAPLATALPVYIAQFGCYGVMLNYLAGSPNVWKLTHASGPPAPLTHHLVAGTVAGTASTLITTPTDLVKIRMMTQQQQQRTNPSAEKPYRNSLHCAASVLKSHGLPGLYRGLCLNAVKDGLSFGAYFYLYHLLSRSAASWLSTHKRMVERPKLANTIGTIVGGGMAGALSWTLVHPLDVIKSIIQAQSLDIKPAPIAIARQGWREGGRRFLFRGWCANTMRAFPCCAATFVVYDSLLTTMRRRKQDLVRFVPLAASGKDEDCHCETAHAH